jgi:FtsP/CotA-like multicopper oxidase with cupredoxin domain
MDSRWLMVQGRLSLLIFLALNLFAGATFGCPWCQTNLLQKPTVHAGTPDPGGKFFGRPPPPKLTRHYYIAAEPYRWNFVPLSSDPTTKSPLPSAILRRPSSSKTRYIQYTDETFSVQAVSSDRLGILGPVLRGTVGEYLAVTFLNRAERPLSMHPHGAKYDKDSEGSAYFPNPGLGAAIAPGARFTYVWKLDASSGPLPTEASSKAWFYHSHVLADEEINAGLMGLIIVSDPRRARADGTPRDVDREMAALFMVFDESHVGDDDESPKFDTTKPLTMEQAARQTGDYVRRLKEREQAARHTINGFAFANLPGLEMKEGERVRWYLLALGSEHDMHTAHWHGARVIDDTHRRTDVVELLPGSVRVADMLADNPGSWLFHCHVADHMMEGMYAQFRVRPKTFADSEVSLEEPFFSLSPVPESLRVKSLQIETDFSPNAPEPATFKLAGQMSLANLPHFDGARIEMEFGGKLVSLQLDANGRGESKEAKLALQLLRAGDGQPGVTVHCEVSLFGAGWLPVFTKIGVRNVTKPAPGIALAAPFLLRINEFTSTATLSFNYESKRNSRGLGRLGY